MLFSEVIAVYCENYKKHANVYHRVGDVGGDEQVAASHVHLM
jgi:hypothetical protein